MLQPHALLIDFGGTLCHDFFWRSLPQDQFLRMESYLFGVDRTLVNDWMRGKYTSEQVSQRLAQHLGVDEQWLWEQFVRDCQTMRVNEVVRQRLEELKKRFALALVTDNMDSFTRFTVPALKFEYLFSLVVSSYEHRMLKNDAHGAIFERTAKALEQEISSMVLLDDSPSTCALFQELGGHAMLVNNEQHFLSLLQSL